MRWFTECCNSCDMLKQSELAFNKLFMMWREKKSLMLNWVHQDWPGMACQKKTTFSFCGGIEYWGGREKICGLAKELGIVATQGAFTLKPCSQLLSIYFRNSDLCCLPLSLQEKSAEVGSSMIHWLLLTAH